MTVGKIHDHRRVHLSSDVVRTIGAVKCRNRFICPVSDVMFRHESNNIFDLWNDGFEEHSDECQTRDWSSSYFTGIGPLESETYTDVSV